MTKETASQILARKVVGLRYQDLPPEAIYHAKRAMLDTLGVQLRGATLPWVQPVYQCFRNIGGNDAATISYHGEKVYAPYAAYVNSVFAYSCELQHHGAPYSAHVGVVVVPVVQALGELLGSSGKDIVTAMAAGYEVAGLLGEAINKPEFPNYYINRNRHFHLQGMLAVYSATTAAGKLLGLTEAQLTHAYGIAGSSASGLLAYDSAGGEVKRTHGALGARGGMQAAMLAKAGLTGPLPVFEGRHGWFEAFGGAAPAEPQKLFDDFGKAPYCVTLCRYRVYSAIGTSHSPIDIIKDLMKQHAFKHTDVDSVRVGLYERGLHHTGAIKRPHDVISAQASMAYGVAIRLIKGSNTLEMYLDPKLWTDPEVLSLVDRVEGHVVAKAGAPRFTTVDVKLKNGQVLHGELDATPGSEESPFSDETMAEKFRGLAEVVIPRRQVDAVMQVVNSLESMQSMAELAPLLQQAR